MNENYLIIEMREDVATRILTKLLQPEHEYHDLLESIKTTIRGVIGDRLMVIYEYAGEFDEHYGDGVKIYTTKKKPELDKVWGKKPSIISLTTINRFIKMFNFFGIMLKRRSPDILDFLMDQLDNSGRIASRNNIPFEIRVPVIDDKLVKKAKKMLPALVSELVISFESNYNAKTLVLHYTDNDASLGLYCWDGRRYAKCEQFAKYWLKTIYDTLELASKKVRYTTLLREFGAQLDSYSKYFLKTEPMLVSFKNVILDWRKLLDGVLEDAFLQHSPDLIVRHFIPWSIETGIIVKHYNEEYTPENFGKITDEYTPSFKELFKQWVNDNWINLYEIIGYTLYPKYDLHKAVMLVGQGSNGKSTFLSLLRILLGAENVSAISLQELCDPDNRFAKTQLFGKLANIYPDLPREPVTDTGTFKMLTGEDMLMADRKFKEPIRFVNYAKLIFSANELPKVSDTTYAFWRRWIVIRFPNQFKPISNFLNNFLLEHGEEIPRLLALSILAIKNTLKRGSFTYEGSALDYKELWLRKVDPVYRFIQEMIEQGVYVKDPDGKVERDKLFEEYQQWVDKKNTEDEEDLPRLNKRQFTIAMEKHGFRRVKIGSRYYYKGLRPASPNTFF